MFQHAYPTIGFPLSLAINHVSQPTIFKINNLRRFHILADNYDVLIVGGGVAGMTAAMYAARHGMRTGIIEKMMGGASIINIEKIDNFPGFPDGISGAELGPAVQEQAMNAGADFIMGDTTKITTDGEYRVVSSDAGESRAKAVIIAAGSTLRQLGIPCLLYTSPSPRD